jgi:hypothetical protein
MLLPLVERSRTPKRPQFDGRVVVDLYGGPFRAIWSVRLARQHEGFSVPPGYIGHANIAARFLCRKCTNNRRAQFWIRRPRVTALGQQGRKFCAVSYQYRRRDDFFFPLAAAVHEFNYRECLFPLRARIACCKRCYEDRIGNPAFCFIRFIFCDKVDAIAAKLNFTDDSLLCRLCHNISPVGWLFRFQFPLQFCF